MSSRIFQPIFGDARSRSHSRDGTGITPPPSSLVVAASKTFKSRLLNVTKRSSCQFRGIFKPLLLAADLDELGWGGGKKKKKKTWTRRSTIDSKQKVETNVYLKKSNCFLNDLENFFSFQKRKFEI